MKYIITQNRNEITVSCNGIEFLKVKTKLNWLSTFKLKFFKDDDLILISTCRLFGFKRLIKFKYVKAGFDISLKKQSGKTYLLANSNSYGLIWRHFSNIQNITTRNNKPAAELYIKKTLKIWYLSNADTRIFSFNLYEENPSDVLFLLVRNLLEFPSLRD